jgi:hypothetical protein
VSSITIQIRDQLIAELNAAPPLGVPAATNRRRIPGQNDKAAAIGVFFHAEDNHLPQGQGGMLTARKLHIAVQCTASADTAPLVDDVLEPLRVHVVNTLGATRLNNLITGITEAKATWETVSLDKFYSAVTIIFEIDYQTKRNDISAKQ